MLWRRRMMQKFGGESFHNSIHIVHAKLALIDQEPISWRFAFEERHGSFDSPNSPNKRSDQQRDDTEMRDEKREVMFAPGQRESAEQVRFAPSKTSQILN